MTDRYGYDHGSERAHLVLDHNLGAYAMSSEAVTAEILLLGSPLLGGCARCAALQRRANGAPVVSGALGIEAQS